VQIAIQSADRGLVAAGLAALAIGLAAWRAYPPDAGQPLRFLVLNSVLVLLGPVLAGVGLVRLSRRGILVGALGRRETGHTSGRLVLAIVVGTALTAFAPHLALVFAGLVAVSWFGWLGQPRLRRRPLPVAPAMTLLLVPAYALLAGIAGPEGLRMPALPLVPLSPAAERLVAPLLFLAAWGAAGLWPLHRQLPGALTAPAAAIMLARAGLVALPDGLAYWRPIAYPLLVVGMWHASLAGRAELLAAGGALLGLLSLDPHGISGAAWLLAVGVGLVVTSAWGLDRPWSRLALILAAAWGTLEVTAGGLRVEVVYTVLAVVGAGFAMMARAPKKGDVSAESPSVVTR
jgi:hypothetical protein